MAKAKRQRRNSIRTMSADASALDALESLERAERSASVEPAGDSGPAASEEPREDDDPRAVAAGEPGRD
ncbi:hypothetical protein [Miltoncostaea marina]|uniref:hypothetical protein n=1 Tax=Miltoncostaea marina TaxID=2843215 RepID=UPI001C3D722E|nr:hypothetical protein [Miltoncostaea marina]